MKNLFTLLLLTILVSCGNNDSNTTPGSTQPTTVNPDQPTIIGYQLIKEYPHDTSCYTEGLQYIDGKMLESGGLNGQSDLRLTELQTGKILKKVDLADKYFGEGCTELNGKIYQMTYQEKTCFVYDAASFKKIGEFNYNFGEGWGMTTDGTNLIISNGGSNLFFYEPTAFKEVKRIGVTNQYGPVSKLNELELINGYVYANVWMSDEIYKIDTASGKVVSVISFKDLRGKTGIPEANTYEESTAPEVMNGIAYDAAGDRIFVTGKYWPKLFEVKFDH